MLSDSVYLHYQILNDAFLLIVAFDADSGINYGNVIMPLVAFYAADKLVKRLSADRTP